MSTPNPNYDPEWEQKWRGARLRAEAGNYASLEDIYENLENGYETLEQLHAAYLRHLEEDFPMAELFRFDAASGLEGLKQSLHALRL